MDIEDFLMRILLILVVILGPALLLKGETGLLKAVAYEMLEAYTYLRDILYVFVHFDYA